MKIGLVLLLHNGYNSLVFRISNKILDLQLYDNEVLVIDYTWKSGKWQKLYLA